MRVDILGFVQFDAEKIIGDLQEQGATREEAAQVMAAITERVMQAFLAISPKEQGNLNFEESSSLGHGIMRGIQDV